MIKSNTNLILIDHPLVKENLSIIRNKETSPDEFRISLRRLSYFLLYQAFGNLPTMDVKINTPVAEANIEKLSNDINVIITPILRAGLIYADIAGELLPNANILHVGMYRDEKTLKPVWYYNKIPIELNNTKETYVYILDPMLATGNSAIETIKLFINKNIDQSRIRFVSLISSKQGINNIFKEFPDITVITASVDAELNAQGYIVPGLGDAGDRIFNTL